MIRRLLGDQKGVAAIEAALVLPILFLMLAGIMEYSRVLLAQHMLRDLIDEAARRGAVQQLAATEVADSVTTGAALIPGLSDYTVTVQRTEANLNITVDGEVQLFFGTLLPSDLVSFSLVAQYPM